MHFKKIACIFLLIPLLALSFPSTSHSGAIPLPWKKEHADALRVFQFLNYINFALSETIKTEDALILGRNYDLLSGNIDLAEVKDEQVINILESMGTLVDRTKSDKLTKKLMEIYNSRLISSIYSNIDNYGTLENAILIEVPKQPSPWIDYNRDREFYGKTLGNKIELSSKQLKAITELRKEMLRVSWELLGKYEVGKRELLAYKAIDRFVDIIGERDPFLISRQLRRLLKDNPSFESFPPFWFYFGMAERRKEDPSRTDFALTCFDRYVNTYRDIFKKDPLLKVTALERISLLPRDSRVQRIKNLEIIKSNATADDWQFFLYSAIINGQIGFIPQAVEDLQRNVDDGNFPSLSRRVMGGTLRYVRDLRGFRNSMEYAIEDNRTNPYDILSIVPFCNSPKCQEWILEQAKEMTFTITGSKKLFGTLSLPEDWITPDCSFSIKIEDTSSDVSWVKDIASSDIETLLPNEDREGKLIEIELTEKEKDKLPNIFTTSIDHPLYYIVIEWRVRRAEEGFGQEIKLGLGKIMSFYKPMIADSSMLSFSISGKKFELSQEEIPEETELSSKDIKMTNDTEEKSIDISQDIKFELKSHDTGHAISVDEHSVLSSEDLHSSDIISTDSMTSDISISDDTEK